MITSVACKTEYVTPPSGQDVPQPPSTVIIPNGCGREQEVTADVNLMGVTEMESTHLQHLINMEVQVPDGEVRFNPSSYTVVKPTSRTCPSPSGSPARRPNALTLAYSDAQCLALNIETTENRQEVSMALYNHSSGDSNPGQKTPVRCAEVPSPLLPKVKYAVGGLKGSHRNIPPGPRTNPPARVCLETRFNCEPTDLTKQQEAAVLNIFLSLLHQSTDMSGIALHSPPDQWPKTEQVVTAGLAYEGNPDNPSGPVTSQGDFSQLTENKKQSEVISPRKLSYSSTGNQSTDAVVTSPCNIYTDGVDLQQETLCVSSLSPMKVVRKVRKRVRMHNSRALQVLDLNTIQGSKNINMRAGSKAGRRAEPSQENSECRERHNRKERERRKRIRLCCDELNRLVPFCNPETDKASTLQWTTTFLKYIKEVYGDSIKQEFQKTFCGMTGVRLKPSSADVVPECESSSSNLHLTTVRGESPS